MRISDWSSDVCSSDLGRVHAGLSFGIGTRTAPAVHAAVAAHPQVARGGERDEGLLQVAEAIAVHVVEARRRPPFVKHAHAPAVGLVPARRLADAVGAAEPLVVECLGYPRHARVELVPGRAPAAAVKERPAEKRGERGVGRHSSSTPTILKSDLSRRTVLPTLLAPQNSLSLSDLAITATRAWRSSSVALQPPP